MRKIIVHTFSPALLSVKIPLEYVNMSNPVETNKVTVRMEGFTARI